MRDIVRESGLLRETIHFYVQQGLLPKPLKTGRNTALYAAEHLERLRRIRELQETQFLPLRAIRAILDDTADEDFTPEQEDLVRRVRATLPGWISEQPSPTVALSDFVPSRVIEQAGPIVGRLLGALHRRRLDPPCATPSTRRPRTGTICAARSTAQRCCRRSARRTSIRAARTGPYSRSSWYRSRASPRTASA
jgi:DNA-binding transcriptional MerR regulator